MKNFAIVIPVYNEEKTIMTVINEIRSKGYPYIIVNDGSTDNTSKILVENNIRHINIFPNVGKGNAIKEGADWLIWKGYTWIGVVDSDGQISVENIESLLKLKDIHSNTKILIGNRLYNPKEMPKLRLITNKIMSWLVSLLANQKIYDSQCGLKIIHKDVFYLNLKCNSFDFDSEVLIKAGRKGYKILSRPIECIYFKGRVSKMNYLKDCYRFVRLIIRLMLGHN